MNRILYAKPAACLTALALMLAWLPLGTAGAAAQDRDTSDGVELRPGLLIHPTLGVAYVMTPEGVAAVDIATGKKLWTTSAAAKPLTLARNLLVSQAEPKTSPGRLELVALDTRAGGALSVRGTTQLPAGVKAMVGGTPEGKFELAAESAGPAVNLTWSFRPPPSRRRGDRREARGLEKRGTADDALLKQATPESDITAGEFRMSLNTGAVTPQQSVPKSSLLERLMKSAPQWILPAEEKVVTAPTAATQYESADGRHVMASERVADDRTWDKYRWTVYERGARRRLGEIRSHFAFNPFVVRGELVIFETTPFIREDAPPEPAKLRAYSLNTGQETWSVEVRENVYRGPTPP